VSASGGVRSAVPVPGPAGAKYAAVTGDDVLVGAEKARFALAKTANSAAKLTNAAAAASNQVRPAPTQLPGAACTLPGEQA
jgi:hypothetical protein